MPDEEQTAGGSQSPYDAGVQRSADANAPPHLNTLEGRGRDPSLEHLKNMRDQAALEEDAAHLEQFRNYQSGFSNDARSTGDDSAPPNADYNYNNDFAVDGNYPKSSKRRTPRQQEQNKHAQQRYRAKRKAHFDELQGTVNGLVAELQASERQRRALESEVFTLRQREASRQNGPQGAAGAVPSAVPPLPSRVPDSVNAIVDALVSRGVLPPGAASMPPPPPPPVAPATALPTAPSTTPAAAAPAPVFTPQTIHQMLGAFKSELWAFLTANGLFFPARLNATPPIPPLTFVPPALLPQVTDFINMGMELSKQVLRVSGPDAHLVLHDGAPTTHPCAADEATRWREVIAAVAPTPPQVQQITSLRETLLSTLETAYTARIELKTTGFQSLGNDPDTGMPRWAEEILLHAASNSGYGLLAQANSELFDCVEKLKQSVDDDREHIEAAVSQLLLNILTPLQSAKYLAKSHPFSWNVLAFFNAVAVRAG